MYQDEIKKFTIVEKTVFYLTIIISLTIIILSKILYETQFGRAAMAYGLVSLAMISMLRVLKVWGPR